jgi:hypothetical protein
MGKTNIGIHNPKMVEPKTFKEHINMVSFETKIKIKII